MGLAAIENLLQASMGLKVASIGSAAIARAVQERQAICSLTDLQAYCELLRVSATELQELIEGVVVPETWFFRDPPAFTELARVCREEWLPAHPEGVLSLLSLPCSTGEEPYSMAMALLDASIPVSRFRIDAMDISARNLAQAINAVYGRNSFRGHELGFRTRHFDVAAGGHHVRENVRRHVRFQRGNLLAADVLPGAAIYDVIFCRNLLIYFDRPAQDRALEVLNRLLQAEGLLFLAAAETSLPASHGLVSTNAPLAFAFRKAGVPSPGLKPATPRQVKPLASHRRAARVGPTLPVPSAAPPTSPGRSSAAPDAPRSAEPLVDLAETALLADQGHFVEAATRCAEHLRLCGPSAPAYALMGLVREAMGLDAEAAAFYRKALYLDPNHYDTQIHLALLMEKQGDVAAAQVLRNRARRLERKERAPHD
jgi:chemotaxis protein methyltransferase WspC